MALHQTTVCRNAERRKALESIVDKLLELKDKLESIQSEEDAYCNLPEGIQASERGESMSENADTL